MAASPSSRLLYALLIGGVAGALFWGGVREARLARSAKQARCEVSRGEVREEREDNESLFVLGVELHGPGDTTTWHDLQSFETETEARALLTQLPPGHPLDCWYDPAQPAAVRIDRPSATAAVGYLVFGGVGLFVAASLGARAWLRWRRDRSTPSPTPAAIPGEPRPVATPRAASHYRRPPNCPDLLARYAPIDAYPLPKVRRRVGRELAVALEADSSARGNIGLLVFAALWNAACWPFFLRSLVEVGSDPIYLVAAGFLGVFVAIGVRLGHQALLPYTTRWRRVPTIEVDHEPVALGDELGVWLRQPGPATSHRYEVQIVCEECARSTFGTDVTTEQRTVWQASLFARDALEVPRDTPFEHLMVCTIPARLPHSFEGVYSEVVWKIVVRAVLAHLPDLDESFPLRVLPRGD